MEPSHDDTPRPDAQPVGAGPLVVFADDDEASRTIVSRWLSRADMRSVAYADAETMLAGLAGLLPDVICVDLGLPGMSGLEAIPRIRALHPRVPVLILTGVRDIETVVSVMQAGAYDYLTKPLDRTKLVNSLRLAAERHQLSLRVGELERVLQGPGPGRIVGRSAPMREVFRQLERVAASDITVLVRGESGTGKELVARAIHDGSARASGPFVALSCAAIPESLQESELFGHEKGAFTGAEQARVGRFEQADGGTLFLDEIGELSLPLQAKLLRVLQERRFERLGGRRTIESSFRLVAATHRDLHAMVRAGSFREDLYFRVAVMELELPPLRARVGDLPLLVESLLAQLTPAGRRVPVVEPATLVALSAYPWPGNVRELQNVLQRALVLAEGDAIRVDDLPHRLRVGVAIEPGLDEPAWSAAVAQPPLDAGAPPSAGAPPDGSLAAIERWAIERALRERGGRLQDVAVALGISRSTLYRKLREYGLAEDTSQPRTRRKTRRRS